LGICYAEAKSRGWNISKHHVFFDLGFKANWDLNSRPGFSALMEVAAKQHRQFEFLMVDATESLSRVTSEVLKAFSELARRGIILVATNTRN
jgi:DNA invertase Pin-like site-specific DNA recombinase